MAPLPRLTWHPHLSSYTLVLTLAPGQTGQSLIPPPPLDLGPFQAISVDAFNSSFHSCHAYRAVFLFVSLTQSCGQHPKPTLHAQPKTAYGWASKSSRNTPLNPATLHRAARSKRLSTYIVCSSPSPRKHKARYGRLPFIDVSAPSARVLINVAQTRKRARTLACRSQRRKRARTPPKQAPLAPWTHAS